MTWRVSMVALLLAACTAEPQAGQWQIELRDGLADTAVVVEARIGAGTCDDTGEELYRATTRLGADAPRPPLLRTGVYCFSARVRDDRCEWIGRGAVTINLPLRFRGPVIVPVEAGDGGAACDDEFCDEGMCGTEGMDGGVESDGGDEDAGPDSDGAIDEGTDADGVDAGLGFECDSASDCGATATCWGRQCHETCRSILYDPACPAGTICTEGLCVSECSSDSDCAPGLECDSFDHICVPEYDCGDAACAPGYGCADFIESNTCWPTCTSDADCQGALRCIGIGPELFCLPGCTDASDCPKGADCLTAFGGGPITSICAFPCLTVADCPGSGLDWFCDGYCFPD